MDLLTNIEGEATQKLSISELTSLLRCSKQHDYAYRQGLQQQTEPGYFTKGKYAHQLLAEYLTLFKQGEDVRDVEALSQNVLMQAALARKEATAEGRLPEAPVDEPSRLEINKVVGDYLSTLSMDGIEVVAVEQEFAADVGLNGVALHGFIDAVLRRDDELWVVEHKTASRAWSQSQFQFAYQPKVYAKAWLALTGELPDGILYNFFYPKRHETKALYTSEAEIDLLMLELRAALALRDSELIVRQPHWGCNDCRFRELCYAELSGTPNSIREDQFVVDPARVERFATPEGASA